MQVTNYYGNPTATNTYDEYGIPDTASGNDIATKGRFRYSAPRTSAGGTWRSKPKRGCQSWAF